MVKSQLLSTPLSGASDTGWALFLKIRSSLSFQNHNSCQFPPFSLATFLSLFSWIPLCFFTSPASVFHPLFVSAKNLDQYFSPFFSNHYWSTYEPIQLFSLIHSTLPNFNAKGTKRIYSYPDSHHYPEFNNTANSANYFSKYVINQTSLPQDHHYLSVLSV